MVRHSILSRANSLQGMHLTKVDPAQFASSVRQFAFDAHRILNDRFAATHELVELSGRIDALWRSCPFPRAEGLDKWLRGARDRIHEHDDWPGYPSGGPDGPSGDVVDSGLARTLR